MSTFPNPAQPGKDIHTTIDVELQKLGEELMQNKIGSIVAIEPSSGEVLCMVSAPYYKPSLLTGKDFAKAYKNLKRNDSIKPLINRPIYNDKYRPGSIFKLVQALIAMENGVIDSNTSFICDKSIIGCHNHEQPDNLMKAIKHSCNPYFFHVYKKIILSNHFDNYFEESRKGLKKWEEDVRSFVIDPMITVIEDANTGVQGEVEGSAEAVVLLTNGEDTLSTYLNAEGQFLLRGVESGMYDLIVQTAKDSLMNSMNRTKVEQVVVSEGQISQVGTIQF